MRNVRRVFSIGIALVLVFTLCLTGCTTTTPSASSSSTSSAASAATPTATPPVTLKWYFGGNFPQADQDAVFKAINVILKDKLNVTVEFAATAWANYATKMSTVISSGEEYDVCYTSNWINDYATAVGQGAFLALDDLLAKDMPLTYAAVPAAFWNAAKIGGKIYGVVNQQVAARCAALYFKADYATTYGSPASLVKPGDISTLTPWLAKVHAGVPKASANIDVTSVAEYLGQDWLASWSIPGAINVNDPTLTVFNQWESPAMLSLAKTLREWNAAGYIDAQAILTGGTTNTMMTLGATYKPGDPEAQLAATPSFIELPSNGSVLTTGGIIATMSAISKTSKNPDLALKMLEIVNTNSDVANMMSYGIKGTHWDLDADGFLIAGPSQSKYSAYTPWEFGSTYVTAVVKGQPKDLWKQTVDFNNNAVKSPALGFEFDTKPVKDKIAQVSAVMTTNYKSIGTGTFTEAQYKNFITQLKAAGSDDIVAEMQKQVNAWKAAK